MKQIFSLSFPEFDNTNNKKGTWCTTKVLWTCPHKWKAKKTKSGCERFIAHECNSIKCLAPYTYVFGN